MNNLAINDLTIGIVASLLSMFLVWLAKEYILPEMKRKIFSDFPLVAGTYDLIRISYNMDQEDGRTSIKRVELKQWGAKVWGNITDEGKKSRSRVRGYVTGSRILSFSFEAENRNINDHGTAMLKLSHDGQKFTGIATFLCGCCEDITPTRVIMKKQNK